MAPQREWFEKDYYKVLGVAETATAREITKRYRQLARQSHPDANPGDAASEERFKEVSAAYDVLGDEAKRAEYDEARRLGAQVGGFGGGGPGGHTFTADDLGGLFGNLFGGGRGAPGGRGPRSRPGAGPARGDDLEADLHLSFSDAVHGVTTVVNLTSDAACATCRGSGAATGSAPQRCATCAGSGFIEENQGFFAFSQPCPACGGRGSIVTDPCPACGGRGTEVRPREVKVRIPAGVEPEQRIRIAGRGGPGRNGGPAGDLLVRVHVAPHALFGRSGRDLTITVPITFPEAALGADIRVPTLDADPVTVRIQPGTPTGKTFRVKGRGIGTRKGSGHLLVTVEVAVPARLSREERKCVEALAHLQTESPRPDPPFPDEQRAEPAPVDEPVPAASSGDEPTAEAGG